MSVNIKQRLRERRQLSTKQKLLNQIATLKQRMVPINENYHVYCCETPTTYDSCGHICADSEICYRIAEWEQYIQENPKRDVSLAHIIRDVTRDKQKFANWVDNGGCIVCDPAYKCMHSECIQSWKQECVRYREQLQRHQAELDVLYAKIHNDNNHNNM